MKLTSLMLAEEQNPLIPWTVVATQNAHIKTESVAASIPYKAEIVAGSTDYVDFLQNKRDSYFWISGVYFCNAPMKIDLKFQTVDAPNAGCVLFDVVRAMKLALNKKLKVQLNRFVLTRLNVRRKWFRLKQQKKNSQNS